MSKNQLLSSGLLIIVISIAEKLALLGVIEPSHFNFFFLPFLILHGVLLGFLIRKSSDEPEQLIKSIRLLGVLDFLALITWANVLTVSFQIDQAIDLFSWYSLALLIIYVLFAGQKKLTSRNRLVTLKGAKNFWFYAPFVNLFDLSRGIGEMAKLAILILTLLLPVFVWTGYSVKSALVIYSSTLVLYLITRGIEYIDDRLFLGIPSEIVNGPITSTAVE